MRCALPAGWWCRIFWTAVLSGTTHPPMSPVGIPITMDPPCAVRAPSAPLRLRAQDCARLGCLVARQEVRLSLGRSRRGGIAAGR